MKIFVAIAAKTGQTGYIYICEIKSHQHVQGALQLGANFDPCGWHRRPGGCRDVRDVHATAAAPAVASDTAVEQLYCKAYAPLPHGTSRLSRFRFGQSVPTPSLCGEEHGAHFAQQRNRRIAIFTCDESSNPKLSSKPTTVQTI